MTSPDPARGRVPDLPVGIDRMLGSEQAKLVVYEICLAIAFGLYLLVHGWGQGAAFWFVALLAIVGLAAANILTGFAHRDSLLRTSVVIAAGLAIVVPLAGLAVARGSLAAAIANSAVWPQILVTLFASRVLAELCDLQFSAAWRDPYRARQSAQVQSVPAALALGACLALLFYQSAWQITGESAPSSSVVVHALLGDTVIHYAIIALFFVILAFLIDATRLYARDRAVLTALRAAVASQGGHARPADLRRLLLTQLAPWSQARSYHAVLDALDGGEPGRGRTSSVALVGFHQASRRFVRGLIPFLTLMGFLGTVIGLSIALSELPHGLGAGQRESFDIGGSLAGLAIKFETTLLGLVGSLVASLALALLEKAEAELAAECALVVEAARAGERGDAA